MSPPQPRESDSLLAATSATPSQRSRSAFIAVGVVAVASVLVIGLSRSSDGPGTARQQEVVKTVTQNVRIPELQPISTLDPKFANCPHTDRPKDGWPGDVWGPLRNDSRGLRTSLPTNAWWENIVLGNPTQSRSENGIVAIPYTIDTAGDIPGARVHWPRVFAGSDLIVMTQFDWRHALQLGSVHNMTTHTVAEPGPLSITLQWKELSDGAPDEGRYMQMPVVRGSPYVTMEYFDAQPMIMLRQEITRFHVDNRPHVCTSEGILITIHREAELVFSGDVSSDNTWLVFVSEPTQFICRMRFAEEMGEGPTPGAPGKMIIMPRFSLTATGRMQRGGVVRAALANNCTMGTNYANCDGSSHGRDTSAYAKLLRDHAMVYATGESRVGFSSATLDWVTSEIEKEDAGAKSGDDQIEGVGKEDTTLGGVVVSGMEQEKGQLRFIWGTKRMDAGRLKHDMLAGEASGTEATADELLMFSLPHHREALERAHLEPGGTPTLHGFANLMLGDTWNMDVILPPVTFGCKHPVRSEMRHDINSALDYDIDYELPDNYMKGGGDTYFSGKMLAKMARIALIAEEMGRHEDAMAVSLRLTEAAQVWLNGTASAPLLYDYRWGGIVSCGCNFDKKVKGYCNNEVSADGCPGLSDVGHNFGLGFYNDHHFHFGYHIYAAAVAAKFHPDWAMKYFEHVLLLVRDIANPSPSDPFFPLFRHKDWYLGSSWALGIATLGGVPYANGRNEESSSEAVNAYDAVALYGHQMAKVFARAGDMARANTASHVRDTGRMLSAMEIRSAQVYWHVKAPGTPGSGRIYPEGYKGKVVGMLWSALAQMQTWFGSEAWKVFGIQMLPITGVSERLLEKEWVKQMLPDFKESCWDPINPISMCVEQGWSMLVNVAQAITGEWRLARDGILDLPDSAFEGAGGNGHSRSNMLWFISTQRTDAEDAAEEEEEVGAYGDDDGATEP